MHAITSDVIIIDIQTNSKHFFFESCKEIISLHTIKNISEFDEIQCLNGMTFVKDG